jgi:hypothetical protein
MFKLMRLRRQISIVRGAVDPPFTSRRDENRHFFRSKIFSKKVKKSLPAFGKFNKRGKVG